MTEREDAIRRIKTVLQLTHTKSLTVTIPRHTAELVVSMLEEQEAVEPDSYMDGLVQRFTCGKCGKRLLYAKWGHDNFCSKCGKRVKWE